MWLQIVQLLLFQLSMKEINTKRRLANGHFTHWKNTKFSNINLFHPELE